MLRKYAANLNCCCELAPIPLFLCQLFDTAQSGKSLAHVKHAVGSTTSAATAANCSRMFFELCWDLGIGGASLATKPLGLKVWRWENHTADPCWGHNEHLVPWLFFLLLAQYSQASSLYWTICPSGCLVSPRILVQEPPWFSAWHHLCGRKCHNSAESI